MSNFTKPERREGVPRNFYPGAEYVNGTGSTHLWVCDDRCESAGGTVECCTGDLKCDLYPMTWREMSALGMWLIEQADIARDAQLKEERWAAGC